MIDYDLRAEDGRVVFEIGAVSVSILPEQAITIASDLTEVAQEADFQERESEDG